MPHFAFQFSLNETYFIGNTVKGAFEYDAGKVIVILNGSRSIRFIDRNLRKEVIEQSIQNISTENAYCSLIPFPNFDI